MTHESDLETSPTTTTAPNRKVVYRIVDTATQQLVPPEDEDMNVVASTGTELNAADEKAKRDALENGLAASGVTGQLPDDIAQAIQINNAKSIGEQPAILANLALAQKIFNQNMQQQNAISHQQAMNQIKMAVIAKCAAMIDSIGSNDQATIEKVGADIEKLIQHMERIIDGKASSSASQQTP
jgi:hypothetical protein